VGCRVEGSAKRPVQTRSRSVLVLVLVLPFGGGDAPTPKWLRHSATLHSRFKPYLTYLFRSVKGRTRYEALQKRVLRRFQWMAFDADCSCSAVGHVLPLVRGAPASRGLASASRRSLFSAVAWAGRPNRHPGRVCSPDPFYPLRPEPISSPCRAPTHWKRRRTQNRGARPALENTPRAPLMARSTRGVIPGLSPAPAQPAGPRAPRARRPSSAPRRATHWPARAPARPRQTCPSGSCAG